MQKITSQDLLNNLKTLKERVQELKSSDDFKRYVDMCAMFHHYSFHNTLLIHHQLPTATRVMGFRGWQKLNRFVKKGATGIRILVPMFFKIAEKDASGIEEEKRRVWFKVGSVFDVSQTEGDTLPEWDISTPEQEVKNLDILVAVIKSEGIAVEFIADIHAYGVSQGGKILIRTSGSNNATRFTTLIHEYAHELLHKIKDIALTREEMEIEAETVSYIVCKRWGMSVESSERYLAYWMNRADIIDHVERVRKAAVHIIDAMEDLLGIKKADDAAA